MMTLQHVTLVQFFMFERLNIRLGEITGLFGPNGSGKSSFLDAVQIAMMGANARLVSFNAQANESRTNRSIRSYCLGQYGERPDDRVRQTAHTYITLVWRDTETNAPVSMGVCIYASGEDEQHKVLGRYILRDVELTLGDHLETVDGAERPREWTTFSQQLKEHARVSGNDPLHSDAERYIRDALLALRGANGLPNYDAFVRAFRFALRMRFGNSPDEIIRNEVIESSPTNIRKFREITESFQRLSNLVSIVRKRIEDGAVIRLHYDKAADARRKAVTWNALALDVDSEIASEKKDAADKDAADAKSALKVIIEKIDKVKTQEEEARNQARKIREQREQHSRHKDLAAAQADLERARKQMEHRASNIRKEMGDMGKALTALSRHPALSDLAAQLKVAADQVDTLAEIAPEFTVDVLLQRSESIWEIGASIQKALNSELARLDRQKNDIDSDLDNTVKALERIGAGKPPLSPGYTMLATELRHHGINARHVCDLVDISDKRWQSAIESYLSNNIEAIVVDEADERQAFEIYRRLPAGRDIYGLKIVRGSRQTIGQTPRPGTVAALIQGSDSVAQAFLRGLFGDMMCAETTDEAMSAKSALTPDGMLIKGSTIERLRPVQLFQFKIGPVTEGHKANLEDERNRLQGELKAIMLPITINQSMRDMADAIPSAENARRYLGPQYEDIANARDRLRELDSAMKTPEAAEYMALADEEKHLSVRGNLLNDEVIVLSSQKGAAESTLFTREGQAIVAAEHATRARAAAKAAFDDPDCDREYASGRWDDMLNRLRGDYAAMSEHSRTRHADENGKFSTAISRASKATGEFLATHKESISPAILDDWRASRAWINEILARLEGTELLDYEEQLDEAYRASQETFRSDVAIALHNNIVALDQTMDQLNKALANSPPFSNGERYQFVRTKRSAHDGLFQFIENIAAFGPQEDLLGSAGPIPETFRKLLDEKTHPGAKSLPTPLDDYREFFDFDIEIKHVNPTTGREQKHLLSKRIGVGSGGEHKAPLYVIAGAALASAYKLDNKNKDGIRLMLLDEAFQAMDMTNVVATLRYLNDLGLQVFMASPGENQAVLNAFLHRYYDIMKDPDRNVVYVEGHDISEKVRDICRSDLLEFHPELVDQELFESAHG